MVMFATVPMMNEPTNSTDAPVAPDPLPQTPARVGGDAGPQAAAQPEPAGQPTAGSTKRASAESENQPASAAVPESSAATPAPAGDEPTRPSPETPPAPVENKKKWYVVKVQSGREESIRAAIERKVKIEGLEEYFGQIVIPVERYTELNKKNKPVVKERKKFHGYLIAQVEYNDKILSLFRDTSGVGDFVGGTLHRPPTPLTEEEVQKMLDTGEPKADAAQAGGEKLAALKPSQLPNIGEPVRIRDGTFANQVGQVKRIIEPKNANEPFKIEVEVSIFGRPVPVEIEYWQVEPI
jgi:transcriptional antiterminator NusG